MRNNIKTIRVDLPDTVKTFEEEENYFQREFGVGSIDRAGDVPADEDCAGVIELIGKRGD